MVHKPTFGCTTKILSTFITAVAKSLKSHFEKVSIRREEASAGPCQVWKAVNNWFADKDKISFFKNLEELQAI